MARDENPPFGRGETWYGLSPAPAIDSANLGGIQHEGKIWKFEDVTVSASGATGARPARSNRDVYCMCVRNVSGIALLPKRLVTLQKTGTDGKFFLGRVDGYATVTADGPAYPVDEFLTSAGVPNNDLFWIVVRGPATVLTDIAAAAGNVINVGDSVVALTAATSQATTAGRIAAQLLTGATALLANQVQNRVGRALSAATTSNTAADLLIDTITWS